MQKNISMMTKMQHINYWVDTALYDWKGAESAFRTKNYPHCLFWAHLVLEKLAKAHWVKTHQENIQKYTMYTKYAPKNLPMNNWKK